MSGDTQEMIRNGTRITIAYHALHKGEAGLDNLPLVLEQIGDEKMYKRFVHPETGQILENESFRDFVYSSPPKGLGTKQETIYRLCKDNERVLSKVTTWLTGRHGGDRHSDNFKSNNVTLESRRGNSPTYALRKLRKDAPRLHEKVIEGQLSAHAAMVEAGFRKKTITIAVDPESAARSIRKAFSKDQIMVLIDKLRD